MGIGLCFIKLNLHTCNFFCLKFVIWEFLNNFQMWYALNGLLKLVIFTQFQSIQSQFWAVTKISFCQTTFTLGSAKISWSHLFTVWILNKSTFTRNDNTKECSIANAFQFSISRNISKIYWNSLNREKLSKHPCWLKSGVFSRIFP